MLLINLVNQELHPIKSKSSWAVFARDLIYIQKFYKKAAPNFKVALSQYAQQIEKGYGLSKISPNGYSLTNNYVIDSFVKIFDPILNFETKKKSLITTDLILLLSSKHKLNSQLNLLSDHLSYKNSYEFAEILRIAHVEIDSRITFNSSRESLESLTECGETLRMLASIIYAFYSNLHIEKIEWCICCFRRANKNSKYCPTHAPKSTQNNYNYRKYRKFRKKIRKSLKKKRKPITIYYKSLRQIFNTSLHLQLFNKSFNFSENELSNKNLIVANELIFSLVQETQNQPWSLIAQYWYQLIKICYPFIHILCANNTNEYESFEEFVQAIREKLDDKLETENHPLWVIFELNKAEDWLEADSELDKTNEELVIKLFAEGKSVKDIIPVVGLKKAESMKSSKKLKKE